MARVIGARNPHHADGTGQARLTLDLHPIAHRNPSHNSRVTEGYNFKKRTRSRDWLVSILLVSDENTVWTVTTGRGRAAVSDYLRISCTD